MTVSLYLTISLFDINGIEEFLIIEKRFPRVRWILFSNELSEDFIRRMSIARNIWYDFERELR